MARPRATSGRRGPRSDFPSLREERLASPPQKDLRESGELARGEASAGGAEDDEVDVGGCDARLAASARGGTHESGCLTLRAAPRAPGSENRGGRACRAALRGAR